MSEKYKDIQGNEVTLLQLILREPSWAANMIRELKRKVEVLEQEKAELSGLYRDGKRQ